MSQLPPTPGTFLGGRVVFLIDESEALRECIAGGTKSKAESIATALNSTLNQLAAVPDLEVAVASYRGDGSNGADIGCRWAGPLAGRRFVPTTALAESPAVVENRVRRLPVPVDGRFEETVRFPIWYIPQLGGGIFPVLGYGYCRHLVVSGVGPEAVWSKPPLVISFVGDLLPQQLESAVERVQSLATPGGQPLVFHVHLGGNIGRPVLYPSSDVHLPPGPPQDLFRWSSVLPEYMVMALRAARVPVSMGAKGMIYNASVADLFRLLSLVRTYAQQGTASGMQGEAPVPLPQDAAVQAVPAGDPPAATSVLLVFVLDRGVGNPQDPNARKAWGRLQDQANDLLTQVGKRARGLPLDVAALTYGDAGDGTAELRSFDGPLAGRQVVSPAELAENPLRTDELSETMSNGIGGLITVHRKRAVFLDQGPTVPVQAATAWSALEAFVAAWRQARPGRPAIVVHLSNGRFKESGAVPALEGLRLAGIVVYHVVVTEAAHRTAICPATCAKIDDPALAEAWGRTSPLLSAARLCDEKRLDSPEARGIVINGKFDLLMEGILDALQPEGRS